MRVIGITGGAGAGKSRVLSYMEKQYKAVICQADHVAWELQGVGQPCYQEILRQFGDGILRRDGTINRNKLGQIVFADKEKLLLLNSIMHPAVKKKVLELIRREKDKGTSLFVLEAALLLETGYDAVCDECWYIYTDDDTRRLRLKSYRNYTDEKIDAIFKSQLTSGEFYRRTRSVIDNSGSFEYTCKQIDSILLHPGKGDFTPAASNERRHI